MKLSISLSSAKQKAQAQTPAAVGSAPSLKRPAAFASLDDEDTTDAAPTASSSRTGNKAHIAQFSINSKAMQKKMEAEKKVDETVYEYDEVWDKMQEAKQKAKEAKEADTKLRKVRLNPFCLSFLNDCTDEGTVSQNILKDCSLQLRLEGWTISVRRRR
jgi:coiled-coil domain-containing protein 55